MGSLTGERVWGWVFIVWGAWGYTNVVGAAFCPEGYGACQGTKKVNKKWAYQMIHPKRLKVNTLSDGLLITIKIKNTKKSGDYNGESLLCWGPTETFTNTTLNSRSTTMENMRTSKHQRSSVSLKSCCLTLLWTWAQGELEPQVLLADPLKHDKWQATSLNAFNTSYCCFKAFATQWNCLKLLQM